MKKVVLLPVLVLASAMVLAGCDTSTTSTASESGSEGASSSVGEGTGSGSEGASSSVGEGTGSGSASESIPDSEPDEYTKLADIEVADEMTSRGVYMGKTDLVRSNKKAYNYLWLADGDAAGLVYTVSEDLFDSSWVAGETVLEVTGKVVEYNEFLQFSNISSLTAVEDSSVTPGKAIELTGQDVTIEDVHHLYSIKDAEVASVAGSGEFKITLGGTTYNVRLDNRDIADGPIWDVKAGDKVTMTSFLSAYKGTMQFITAADVTVTPGEEEEPDPEPGEVKYLDEILTLAKDETYTGRAVYMGMTDLNTQYNSHNGVYVADGENWYLLYQVSDDLIPENLVSGQTVLEWDGTVADFKNTKESKVTALRTVIDAEVTAGTWDKLAEDYAPAVEDINRGVVLENAYVANVSVGDHNNTTLTLKASEEGTKTFTVYLDSRYTDVTVPAIADLKVGDTLSGKTFVGENTNDGSIQFIYLIDPVRTPGQGGEDPEPVELPEPVEISIADIIGGTAKEGTLYEVTGILEASKNDQYGNAYLTDPETKSTVMVYGNTTTATALSTTDGTTVEYSNPRDAQTTLADIKDGDKITVHCVYEAYVPTWNPGAAPTHEIMCVTVAHETPADATYAVAIDEAIANGQVTAAATAAYGEDVTLTVTPSEGYAVGEVIVDHGYGTETVAPVEGAYSFKATAINEVSATFVETVEGDLADVTYDLTKVDTKSTNAYDATGLKGHFDASLTSETGIIQSVTATDKVFPGNPKDGPGALNGLKFGTGSVDGYVTILFAADVTSITITAHAWADNKIALIGAYGADDTLLDSAEVNTKAAATVTLEFAATRTLTIKVTEPSGGDRRCVMTSIVFNQTVEA